MYTGMFWVNLISLGDYVFCFIMAVVVIIVIIILIITIIVSCML